MGMPQHEPPELEAPMMCGVCGRVGSFSTRDGHVHSLHDEPADHPMVPVPVEDMPLQLRGRCDFCNDEDPPWELPARTFMYPLPGPIPDDWPLPGSWRGWAACNICADLIRRNSWSWLLRRAVDVRAEGKGARELTFLRTNFGRLYKELRRNITGPIRRYDKETHHEPQ